MMMIALISPLLFALSSALLCAFLALVFIVTFIVPPLFVYFQKHKKYAT